MTEAAPKDDSDGRPSLEIEDNLAKWNAFFENPDEEFVAKLHAAEQNLTPVDTSDPMWLERLVGNAIDEVEDERQALQEDQRQQRDQFLQQMMGQSFYEQHYQPGKDGEGHSDEPL